MVLEDKLKQGVVIEIGAGIGTITDLISSKLRHTTQQISLICYEVNDFCIDQLYKNVNGPFFHIRNLSDLHSYNLGCRKVFLIIDDYISYDDTKYLLEAINPRYVIIEGHRFRQRKAVAKILLNKSIRIRFFGNSIDSVKGACVIIVKTNKYSLLTLLAYWRLILQSSLLTRKIFQSIGIRKRKFLRLLYR
jgi:hypothetical protein